MEFGNAYFHASKLHTLMLLMPDAKFVIFGQQYFQKIVIEICYLKQTFLLPEKTITFQL